MIREGRVIMMMTRARPKRRDGFQTGKEVQGSGTIKIVTTRTGDAVFIAGEAEHGKRDGDGDVDTELTDVDTVLEAMGV